MRRTGALGECLGERELGAGDWGKEFWRAVLAATHGHPLSFHLLEHPSPCHLLRHRLVSSSGACSLPEQNARPPEGRAG